MKKEHLQRTQFTFYASYFAAVEKLPKCHRYEALQGIIRFGLFGEEPELKGAAQSVFEAVRPHLESGRSKAAYRIRKNAQEQSESCPDGAPVFPGVRM